MYMNDGNKTKINLRNKSVFITGVAGFIGSNLAKRLLSTVEGVKVVGLDNMNHYYDVRLKEARLNELEQFDNFSFVKGNLADKAVIESIFEQYKPEIVVNLGAQAGVRYSITNPDAYVEANLIGFYNILEACRHSYDEGHTPVEHLVYASSSSVYGSNKKVPYSTDDKVDNPVSLYAATKKSNELMAHPFIAVGKITLLQGDPGDGKSTMMMNLIAELSKGGKTPDGKPIGTPQRVIYQCSEDGVSDTIKPRLERCGADCRKVAFINEETYSGLTLDDERIRQAIIEFRPRLVVIDPIQAYLGSDSDLQIAGRARKLMQRLGMWASVYDCAIVLIGHLNKKEGTKGLYRSLGSIDVVAAARSVLQVERDQKDTDIRIVRQIKNSLAPSDGEIRFSITAEMGFQWLECKSTFVSSEQPKVPEFESKTEKAAYLIKKLLSDGDMRAREIYMRMKDEGISRRTAENTKKELGIRSYRKMRQWYWSIHTGE